MKRICLCFALILGLAVAFQSPDVSANTLRNYNHGDTLPSFKLSPLGGGPPVEVHTGKGKPAAFMFLSTQPEFRKKRSLALLNALDEIANKYRNKADIVAIYSDTKGVDIVKKYVKDSAIKLKILDDSTADIYNKYGVFMMPLIVFADKDGKLHEVVPYTYNVREHIEGNLKLLLGEWSVEQFQASLEPKEKEHRSDEEKEYIRRVNYGRVMLTRKMYSQAIREFSTAAKLMPNLIEAHLEIGYTQLALEEYEDAKAAFQRALKVDSESDDALAGMGLALYGKGDIERALPELENAMIAPEPKLEVILALAEIHENKGNVKKAMRLNKLAVSKLMTLYEHRWQ